MMHRACPPAPAHDPFMKRLLLIFLLAILPYQSSWAAAAGYCEHGGAASADHFGHHAHQIDADYHAQNTDADLGSIHADCGYCHAAALPAAIPAPPLAVAIFPPRLWLDAPALRYASRIPEGPRRPDRLTAA